MFVLMVIFINTGHYGSFLLPQ